MFGYIYGVLKLRTDLDPKVMDDDPELEIMAFSPERFPKHE